MRVKRCAVALLVRLQLFECHFLLSWVQGWRSGEGTRLPPMWPVFNSRLNVICGLSLLFLYSPTRDLSPATLVFPSPQKPTFDLITINLLISVYSVPN